MAINRDVFPFHNIEFAKLYNGDIGNDPVSDVNFSLTIGYVSNSVTILIKDFLDEQFLKTNKIIRLKSIPYEGKDLLKDVKYCMNSNSTKIINALTITIGKSGKHIRDYTFIIAFISRDNEIILIEIDINGCVLNIINVCKISEANELFGNTNTKLDDKTCTIDIIRGRQFIDDKLYFYLLFNGFDYEAINGNNFSYDSYHTFAVSFQIAERITKTINFEDDIFDNRKVLISRDYWQKYSLIEHKETSLAQNLTSVYDFFNELDKPSTIYSSDVFIDDDFIYSTVFSNDQSVLNLSKLCFNTYIGGFNLNYQDGSLIFTAGEPAELYITTYTKEDYAGLVDPEMLYGQGHPTTERFIYDHQSLQLKIPTVNSGEFQFGNYINMKIKTSMITIPAFKFKLPHVVNESYNKGNNYQIVYDRFTHAAEVLI